MIEILGLAISAEAVIALGVAFLIDEILPFLPIKQNGIAHAIVLGIKRARFGSHQTPQTEKLDEVLLKLQELKDLMRNEQ